MGKASGVWAETSMDDCALLVKLSTPLTARCVRLGGIVCGGSALVRFSARKAGTLSCGRVPVDAAEAADWEAGRGSIGIWH